MELVKKLDYFCTPAGLKLLENNPDFINSVWLNNSKREFWFDKRVKKFTKIKEGDNVYIEKTGTNYIELEIYGEFEDLIRDNGWRNVKMGETYFGDQNKILLKYYPLSFNPHNPSDRDKINFEALESFLEMASAWLCFDSCLEENGDLIIIDPHRS